MIMILSSPFTYLSGGKRILWNGTVAVDLGWREADVGDWGSDAVRSMYTTAMSITIVSRI